MLEGKDFTISYAPIADIIAIRITIAIAALLHMRLYTIDIVNAYQNAIIQNIDDRHYMRLPYLYQEWFKSRWPSHPSNHIPYKQLILQTQKSIQGTPDAGRD